MADGMFPSLVSKDRAVNAAANPIFTQLTDGTTALTVTSGGLNVNVANTSIAVTGSDFDIRPLQAGDGATDDNILIFANTAKDGTGTNYVPLVDTDGKLIISNPGSSGTEYTEDAAAGTATGPAIVVKRDDALSTLSVAEGDWSKLYCSSTGALWVSVDGTVTVSGSVSVSASDLDIRNLNLTDDAVKVSGNSSANSITNPIFVQNVKTSTQAQEVQNYKDGTSTGETGDNHDYTVTGTTFLLTSVIVACSGAMKAEIQTGPVGTLATKAVVFLTGRQGDTKQVFFDPPIEVPATSTGTVRVIRTSRNGTGVNVDLYSTIIGNDVA